MSYSKQSPYAFAIKEMAYWKDRAQNTSRGAPEPWNENRSYREASYDSGTEDRWQSDRMDTGPRSGPPSLFASRPGNSNLTHLSSSNQVNSNLFDNFQSRSGIGRNNDSFSNSFASRGGGDRFRSEGGIYNSSYGGRITRNSLVDSMRAKRILQKRALNAVGSSPLISSAAFRRRKPRVRNTTSTNDNTSKNTKTAGKDKAPNKPDKAPEDLRVAITWVNDTKATISSEQATLLSKKLEQLLDELPVSEDGHIPKFYASGLSAGIYKMVCVDQKTKDWLINTVENFTDLWEGAKFNVIEQSELKNNTLVHVVFIHNDDDIMVLLNRIEKQNPEVKTTTWRVHRETIEENRRTIVFGIDEESLNYLKNNDWKVFLGLRQAKFTQGIPPKVNK